MLPISNRLYLLLLTGSILGFILIGSSQAADTPTQTFSEGSPLQITADTTVIRSASDALIMGFNTPWHAIQGHGAGDDGLWDTTNHQIYPTVLDCIKQNFHGATFRYPGGTVSNYFFWKQSIGPLNSRTAQYIPNWGTSMVPDFGFNEFMGLVEQAGGQSILVINMESATAAQDAADWVEYCNAPNDGSNPGGGTDWAALRAAHGHAPPYNVKFWELGNELDHGSSGWNVGNYITACNSVITAMRNIDSTIRIAPFASTEDFVQNPTTWYDWHRAILANSTLKTMISGMVLHTYYDGYNVANTDHVHAKILVDDLDGLPMWATEHAKWPNPIENQTVWPKTSSILGAISSADMLLAYSHHGNVELALLHALGGTGPWRPFNAVDTQTGTYSSDLAVRPIIHALGLINKYLPNKAVLNTVMTTPNAPSYSGGYDVRAIVLRDADSQGFSIPAVNRCYNINYSAHTTVPDLAAGNYVALRETVGGYDDGSAGVIRDFFNIKVSTDSTNGLFTFPLPKLCVSVLTPVGSNLLLTPDLEADTNSDGVPDNWSKRTPSGTSATFTLLASDALDGSHCVQIVRTGGTSPISLVQGAGNDDLKATGYVGLHTNDYYIATACAKAGSLDSNGAALKIQLFEKNNSNQNVYAGGLTSNNITGTTDHWVTLTSPIFRPADNIDANCTFNYMEVMPQLLSTTGTVNFDSVCLLHLPNRLLNASFETDSDANGTPDNWDKRTASGVTGSVSMQSGEPEHGSSYIRLTKTDSTTGALSVAQSSWNNSELGTDGFVASHTRQTFIATGFFKPTNLDSHGARLRVQIFEKKPDNSIVYLTSLYSDPITGTNTAWTKLTISAFVPNDYIDAGCTLAKLEVIVQNTSTTGYVDVDDVNLYLKP